MMSSQLVRCGLKLCCLESNLAHFRSHNYRKNNIINKLSTIPIMVRLQRMCSTQWSNPQNEIKLFIGNPNIYNGVTVESQLEPSQIIHLSAKLDDSLKKWTEDKVSWIWFKVHIQDSSWVPLLAHKGFHFHHARDDFVMMYRRLHENETILPPVLHTNLSVGALVINSRNQLLAVIEKNLSDLMHWKLPGGYVNRGEDIVDAAIREVREETGVIAEFQSIVTLRHMHQMAFGNSNVYIFVMLNPTTEDITMCQRELDKCQWIDVEKFLNNPKIHEFNRSIVTTALDYRRRGIKIIAEKKTSSTNNKDYTVFSVVEL